MSADGFFADLFTIAKQGVARKLVLSGAVNGHTVNSAWLNGEETETPKFTPQFEREPSADELAQLLDLDLDDVQTTMGVASRHVSMDAPFVSGEESSLLDVLENKNAGKTDDGLAYRDSLKKEIERSLATLTDRQRVVISSYYGINITHPMSLEDIGHLYGLTRERVRQIKDKAISILQSTSTCNLLKSYLGK